MSTDTLTPTQHLESLAKHAEEIQNDDAHDMSTLEVGDQWCQGDVRVIRLPDNAIDMHPELFESDNRFDGKVAPGNTLGSQHVLDSLAGVEAFRTKNATELDGPVIRTSQTRTLNHPEHGDCCNLPAGVYAFPGQRVYAEELRRTLD